MGKSLETLGFVELTNDLAEMAAQIAGGGVGGASVLESILNEAAQPVLEKAQQFAPTKTGKLRAAIKAGKVKRRKDGAYTIKIGTQGKTDAFYAPFVEFGHGGPHPAPPHPFMRPAYDATKEQAYGIIRDRLNEEINKIGG